jgi:hypothetical protein
MRKYFYFLIGAMACSIAASAQTATGAIGQRDPNPPYGAAAGADTNGNTSRAAAGTNQTSAPNTAATAPANGTRGSTATGGGGNPGSTGAQPSSGASSTPGATQGGLAERPGAAIASRGSTTTGNSATPYDPGSTPGWSMMTPQEQQNYSGKMGSFTSVAQCRAYQAAYLAQIQERARRMGQIVQPQENDPCAALQQQGALK